jgi:glycosyltransferase involved in cell wall biosynthesis
LHQKYSRENKIFKYWIKSTEEKILKSVQKIFVASEKDAAIVKEAYNLNACFTHEYIKAFKFYEFEKTNKIFVFFGTWSRKENSAGLIWFLQKVLPIMDLAGGMKFVIIGSGLSKYIKQKYLSLYDSINYLGFVDNPLDIIYRSSALIAPLFAGAGVKVKVIDAFTTGTPVIGTDIAFEGLPDMKNLIYRVHAPKEYAEIITHFPEIQYKEKKKNGDIFKSLYDNNHLQLE